MEPARGNFLYDDVLPRVMQISWPLAMLGVIFRFMLLQGGSMLLMVGIGTLAVVYYLRAFAPSAFTNEDFYTSYEPVPNSPANFLLHAVAPKVQGIATAVCLIGILFKLLVWTGATMLLVIGVLCLAIVLAIHVFNSLLSNELLLFLAIGSTMLLIPTDDIIRRFYRDDPYLVEKMIFQHHHPHDRAAQTEVLRLLHARHGR